MKTKILKGYQQFEQFIVLVLLGLLMAVVLYATVGFLILIVKLMVQNFRASEFHVTLPMLHEVFAGFLMLLIGLELMKTIVMYLDDRIVHVEVVLSVAMIAIARHAIDMDFKSFPPLSMIGTGVIILALAIGYYFFRKVDLLGHPGTRAIDPVKEE